MKKVCALIPLYNEETYAGKTISALQKIKIINEIVTIDDGSVDNTWEVISNIGGIKRIQHNRNMGKAQALMDGIRACNADIYVFIDGDLGDTAGMIEPVIQKVLNNECDMCVARPVNSHGGGVGLLRSFSKFAVKLLTNTDFPCPLCGQRAVKKEVIMNKNVQLYNGYGIEVGMLIDTIKCGYTVGIVDIEFTHRFSGKNIKGFIHRTNQFNDIVIVFFKELIRW